MGLCCTLRLNRFDKARMVRPRGFTLIEVLVVVAIIALLIAILMPALAMARATSRQTQCLSNLHQFGIAITSYANTNRDWIPRGGSATDQHWVHLMMKHLGDNRRYKSVNEVPVGNRPILHCPERIQTLPAPFIDYVNNALDSEGPRRVGSTLRWVEVAQYSRLAEFPRPFEVVYICDAEREDKNLLVVGGANTLVQARTSVPPRVDTMDVWRGDQLPEGPRYRYNISDDPGPRRVARKMHLKRFTNAVFLDGHSEGLQLAPKHLSDVDRYGYWLRRFGVKDVDKVKNMTPNE